MSIKLLNATQDHVKEIRAIAKKFGITHCKKGLHCVMVGRQMNPVSTSEALAFMEAVKQSGYYVDGEDTCIELADKGLSDTFMLFKIRA